MATGNDIKASDFFKNLPNLKILLWLVGGTIVLTLAVYGSSQVALHKSNANSEEALEKIDRLTLIVQANIRYQATKDSIDNLNYIALKQIVTDQTDDIKGIKTKINIMIEAAKSQPQLYASITYLTQLVEQTTNVEKKK